MNPNLYLIYSTEFHDWEDRLKYLEQAAQKLSINAIRVHADDFDYTSWQAIPARKTDMFYNVTPFSHEIENIFIHKGLTSFFIEPNKLNYLFSTHQFELLLINAGIPTPKTILKGTANRELLKKYVAYLGGFPLIVKVTGGTTGIGVMKVDTVEGLLSLCDHLESQKIHFQLKEFIENKGTIRVVVVGNTVISSILRTNVENDFRVSGVAGKNYQPISLSEDNKILCVNAVKACNYQFAGLDLIMDKNGNPYILEVNYPNNFASVTAFNGVDIAFEALQFLKDKSLK